MTRHLQTFNYPEDEEQFVTVKDKDELRTLLRLQHTKLSFRLQYFQISVSRGRYIYAICRKCKAKLKYKKQASGESYKLFYFNNLHQHPLKKGENKVIEKYIQELPQTLPVSHKMTLTKKTFNISRAKFYYLHRKIWYQEITFGQLVKELDSRRYQSRYDPFPLVEKQIPDLFITSSQSMMDNFKNFGQFLSFDITYNLVKQIKQVEGQKPKKWGLGLFLGKNNHNKTIPFAVCLMNSETKNDFKNLFRSFFDIMGSEPQTIITDQQIAIIGALQQLKNERTWDGCHVLDSFHIIKNLRKKTSDQKVFAALHDAMFQKSAGKFQELIQLAKDTARKDNDIQAINSFIRLSHMHCISQTPASFHGISLSTSFHEKTNDLIKTYMTFERPIIYVTRKTLKIMEQLQKNSKTYKMMKFPFQQYVGQYLLKLLRPLISQSIFKEIVKNYCDSLPLLYINAGDDWIFQDGTFKHTVWVEDRKLKCSCQYLKKTGIPCSHLHKIIEVTRDDALVYIHERWKVTGLENSQENRSTIKIKKGRPRNSRRNIY